MKKRFLFLTLLTILSVALLVSCDGNAPEQTTPDTTVAETQPSEEGKVIFAPGVCEYRIVYPADDTDAEFSAARKLQSLIEEKCGVKPEVVRATLACGENYDPNVKEIYLSYVDVEELDFAISQTGYNCGIFCAVGNKIVVTGHERTGFNDAYQSFSNWIEENTVDGKLVIEDGFVLRNENKSNSFAEFAEVPGYPGGKIEDISALGNKYQQVTIYDTDGDMYGEYAKILEDNGYSLYSENEISENLYSTYTKDKEMLYYYYCPNSGETRVIKANNVPLPSLEEVKYTKICEPAYITLEIYNDKGAVNGDAQGAIIRFADGSFLVYDGGNKNSYQAMHIYDTLVKYAPDPQNIVIRAWVFSHFHGDHVGAFQSFVTRYKTNSAIKIESFIYNFCNTTKQTQSFSPGQMTTTENSIKSWDNNVPVYKCLTGQIFRFPGMDMEILATMSDFIPKVIGYEASDADLSKGDGNTMTVVMRLKTPEGNTCMLTGDATNIVLDCMVDRYGAEYLDTDIVTTPHHAHNRDSYRARNATIKFYDAVKPEILVVTSTNYNKFIPTGSYPYEVNVHVIKTYDPEVYLMNQVKAISMTTLKEIK